MEITTQQALQTLLENGIKLSVEDGIKLSVDSGMGWLDILIPMLATIFGGFVTYWGNMESRDK